MWSYNGLVNGSLSSDIIHTIFDHDDKRTEQVKARHVEKQEQQRSLFFEFMGTLMDAKLDCIPKDVSMLIFKYFNLYICNNFDVVQRLMNLMRQKEDVNGEGHQYIALKQLLRNVIRK